MGASPTFLSPPGRCFAASSFQQTSGLGHAVRLHSCTPLTFCPLRTHKATDAALKAIQPLVGQNLAGSRVKRSASATLCRCEYWHVQAAPPLRMKKALCNVTLENPLPKIILLCRRASRRCTWKMRAVMRRHSRTQIQPPLLVPAEAGEAIDRNLAFRLPADAFSKSSSVFQ